jgi:hypothetical protein
MKKKASSQASWSILSEGVSSSRVEAHIIRSAVNQLVEAVKGTPLEEELYKLCGDNLEAIPKHLSKLERSLDRTNYALITMGGEWYRQRLTHEDREMVDMAAKFNPTPFPSVSKSSALHLAGRFKDLEMILEDYEEELVGYDPDFADEDTWNNAKYRALHNGDLETALALTRDPRAREILLEIQSQLNPRRSASQKVADLVQRIERLERKS